MPKTLVLEPDLLIAEDIAEIVRGLVPRAEIFVQTNPLNALAFLGKNRAWDVVIANNSMFQGALSKVRDAIGQPSTLKIMLDTLGEGAAMRAGGWVELDFPFSETTMRNALREWSAAG